MRAVFERSFFEEGTLEAEGFWLRLLMPTDRMMFLG